MKSRTESFIIDELIQGQRLDSFLVNSLHSYSVSRSFVQKLVEKGLVTVEGSKAKSGLKLKAGMKINVEIPEPEALQVESQNIPLDIIYEDKDIIVVNKPKDMVVHPATGNWEGTLVNALLYHCEGSLSDINGVIRPGIVHRIDKDTTGLIVVAKNNEAHIKLSEQLKNYDMKRIYEAIVVGNLKDDSGKISAPIGRHPLNRKKMAVNYKNGKPAVTSFKVLERFGKYTYVQLTLETGRTHQIRVHMASLGHPVVGDTVYGKASKLIDTNGQALHARFLGITHPSTNEEMEFEAPLPKYFVKFLKCLRGTLSDELY